MNPPNPSPLLAEAHLPEGWAVVTLDEIGRLHCGQSPATAQVNTTGKGTPYVTGPEQWNGKVLHVHKFTTDPRRIAPDGCIFITVKGAGVGTLFPGVKAAIGRDVYAFEPNEQLVREFVLRALELTISEIKARATGDIPGLSKDHILTHVIGLPPLIEQKRIVGKIEQLRVYVNASRERLARIPAILKRFRQAVLAAGCSGRLTAEWRESQHSEEQSAALLDEIRIEVFSGKKGSRQTRPVHLDDAPFSVPRSWSWVSTSDVCTAITDGDHQPPPKADRGIPFVVISNVSSGVLDLSETMFVPESYYEGLSKERRPIRGDILYSVTGSYGIPVLVDTDAKFCFQRHIALLRPHERISSKFLWIAMSSPFVYRQSSSVATGIAQMTVPLSGLRALRIPVPPSCEQREIVRRVEALFKVADAIEKRVADANEHVEKLTRAILAKAFRGELVPTEAELARREGRTYETAAELLARIEAAKQQRDLTKPPRARRSQAIRGRSVRRQEA
jgi:type I restriction enzyme S subunit